MRRLDLFAGVEAGLGRARGFTLIEIMVVVVILGILASLVAPTIIQNIEKANISKAKTDIRTMDNALTMYRMSHFKYPTSDQGLEALIEAPIDPSIRNYPKGGYLKSLQRDPWGNPYLYESPGTNGEYDIYTLGRDGQPGGEGVDADVGNWNLDE